MNDFTAYLKNMAAKASRGELGLSAEELEKVERDKAASERLDIERRMGRQLERLPALQLATSRAVLDGRAKAAPATAMLRATLHKAPTASVILCGSTGAGKTTAMTTHGLQRILEGATVGYVEVSRFERVVRLPDLMATLEECGTLYIDEIHRARGLPDWILTPFTGLIDFRYHEQRQMIASGTVQLADLENVVGREIVERFDYRLGTSEASWRKAGR